MQVLSNLCWNGLVFLLGIRVFDISFWKEELLKEINVNENETANLDVSVCDIFVIIALYNN